MLSVGVVYLRHISEHCSDLISQSVLVPLQMWVSNNYYYAIQIILYIELCNNFFNCGGLYIESGVLNSCTPDRILGPSIVKYYTRRRSSMYMCIYLGGMCMYIMSFNCIVTASVCKYYLPLVTLWSRAHLVANGSWRKPQLYKRGGRAYRVWRCSLRISSQQRRWLLSRKYQLISLWCVYIFISILIMQNVQPGQQSTVTVQAMQGAVEI